MLESCIQCLNPVFLLRESGHRCQHDLFSAFVFSYLARQLITVHIRKVNIQQAKIGSLFQCALDSFIGTVLDTNHVPKCRNISTQRFCGIDIIFHDQYLKILYRDISIDFSHVVRDRLMANKPGFICTFSLHYSGQFRSLLEKLFNLLFSKFQAAVEFMIIVACLGRKEPAILVNIPSQKPNHLPLFPDPVTVGLADKDNHCAGFTAHCVYPKM